MIQVVGAGGGVVDEVIHRVVALDFVEMEQVTLTMCIYQRVIAH